MGPSASSALDLSGWEMLLASGYSPVPLHRLLVSGTKTPQERSAQGKSRHRAFSALRDALCLVKPWIKRKDYELMGAGWWQDGITPAEMG